MPKTNNPVSPAPIPWSHPSDWKAAQQSIHYHLNRQPGVREAFIPAVREMERLTQDLAIQMETLCASTCSHCPDPCCLTASVWFDFRDLLSFHLLGTPIPIGQPASDYRGRCRYITPGGCGLPRLIRPWICTWYLCPVQSRWLKKQPGSTGRRLLAALERMKTRRSELETQFLATVGR
jgi:hypothetical protein